MDACAPSLPPHRHTHTHISMRYLCANCIHIYCNLQRKAITLPPFTAIAYHSFHTFNNGAGFNVHDAICVHTFVLHRHIKYKLYTAFPHSYFIDGLAENILQHLPAPKYKYLCLYLELGHLLPLSWKFCDPPTPLAPLMCIIICRRRSIAATARRYTTSRRTHTHTHTHTHSSPPTPCAVPPSASTSLLLLSN